MTRLSGAESILSYYTVQSAGKGTCGSVGKGACGSAGVGLQARVCRSVGAGLNESGTFASLTKESSVAGRTAVNIL